MQKINAGNWQVVPRVVSQVALKLQFHLGLW